MLEVLSDLFVDGEDTIVWRIFFAFLSNAEIPAKGSETLSYFALLFVVCDLSGVVRGNPNAFNSSVGVWLLPDLPLLVFDSLILLNGLLVILPCGGA